jgi:hypothetical protein
MTYAIKDMAILQEAKDVQVKGDKVQFRALLQMMEEYSYNGKKYLREPLMKAIKAKEPLLKRNGFVGELDHPMDPTPQRLLNVLYQNASHLFKEVYTEGNEVWGVVETLSTRMGKDLFALITQDKIPVGFSMRAMGDVRDTRQGQEVFRNIELVTWDCVSTPAFSNCILAEIIAPKYHLESCMINEDISNLEEFLYGSSKNRKDMLMESRVSQRLFNVVENTESKVLFSDRDLQFRYFRRLLMNEAIRNSR